MTVLGVLWLFNTPLELLCRLVIVFWFACSISLFPSPYCEVPNIFYPVVFVCVGGYVLFFCVCVFVFCILIQYWKCLDYEKHHYMDLGDIQ